MLRFSWRGLIPCWACLILLGIASLGSVQFATADEPLTAPVPTADENPQPAATNESAPADPSTAPAQEPSITNETSEPAPVEKAAVDQAVEEVAPTSRVKDEQGENVEHATEHKDDEHKEGVLDPKGDLALWSLITFIVFLFVLKQLAWKPLIKGLDTRESRLRQQLADAQADRQKSMKLLAQHEQQMAKVQEEVREILTEARRDADIARQNILKDAEAEAKATRDRAILEIERSRDAALKDIFLAVADRVTEATEHVLGRALNDEDQNRLVSEALEQVSRKQST